MPRVAYVINQYPKVSHSFIRREILALEAQGAEVQRIALRGWDISVVEPADVEERSKTSYVLKNGGFALMRSTVAMCIARPRRFWKALRLSVQMGWRAERPLAVHLIYLAEACRMIEWLEAYGAEHLHAHFGTNSAEVVMLAHILSGLSYSFTVHGPEEFDKPEFLGLEEKIKRSAFVVAISAFGKSQLYRWSDLSAWHKIKVVHCGLEKSFFATETAVTARPRLVCVGRLCEQKGQLMLVEAARILARKGIDFELVLAGDGEMRGILEDLISRYQLQQYVSITGWLSSEQVRAQLLAARALVLPSFAEGLPVVIMEAMALQRPVISTHIAGIPELVKQGENGWLLCAGELADLVASIEQCLSLSSSELGLLGARGRARVLECHDADREARKLIALFREAIASNKVATVDGRTLCG
ncbi:glycosyltransferase [Noviherbaspirillum malthae]|uniref:glycosyltransferase n=1 Tax=Noviherbaspirillum malthae TaxID=1260987 RepID=UPI0018904D74